MNYLERDMSKKFWFILVAALISFGLVEMALHVAQGLFEFRELKNSRQRELDDRRDLIVYQNQEWASAYYDEIAKMEVDFDPLVGWRPKKIQGQYVNVDADGIRKTWNSSLDSQNGKVVKIFMFGGSALWGAGARDEFTIPSLLSKLLNSDSEKIRYEVTNYGQSGYVSLQEIQAVRRLLTAPIRKG